MFERVIAQVDPSGLTDACGLEPSFVCEWIWDVSDMSVWRKYLPGQLKNL